MFEKSSFKSSEFNNIERSSEIHKSSEMYENNSDDSGVDNEKSPSGLKKEIFQQHISNTKDDDNKEESNEQENRYIRSERVHYYHGQPKHYYLDQPKSSSLLIPVKVRYS